jgi:sugar phosphate isomerase/epimerase
VTIETSKLPAKDLITVTNLKIGIQTRSLRLPLRKAIETAARLGGEGVEIDARTELSPAELSQTGLRQFRKLLDDYRLEVSAVAFPTRRGFDDPDDLERRVMAAQAAMRMAYQLGSQVVVIRPGTVPDVEDDLAESRIVESLTAMGMFGDRVGARPALMPGSEAPAALARLIAQLPEGLVGVDLHPGAIIRAGHAPAAALDELGRYVLHVHACDAVPDGGPGCATEVDLGRGLAEMPALIGQLTAQFDYRGWITIERRDAPDPATSIGNAVAFLRAL